MLVELRIENYRSIYKEQVFSLVASKDSKHPDNLIAVDGFHLLKAAGIYGSNASGKSNLIKAVQFMQQLIAVSATRLNEGDRIQGAVPFLLSAETRMRPCLLEATCVVEGSAYKYGFTATQERIHDEWLRSYTLDGAEQLWFERLFDTKSQETQWHFDGPLRGHQELLQERTRDNSLILSTGPRENVKPLGPIFQWFRQQLSVFDLSASPDSLKFRTAELCRNDGGLKERVARMLKDADFQIDGFDIGSEAIKIGRTEPIFSPDDSQRPEVSFLNNIFTALTDLSKQNYQVPKVQTQHLMIGSDDVVAFDLEEESNGTQRLFALAAPFLHALDTGTVMMIDELDCSLHPNLTRKLIELFQSPSANSRGAQLIFTTHDSTLLDQRIFRRDQIYLVEKMRNRGSEYFSLYDFENKDRPRNTEALQRNYLSGRYGAVPQFGPTFEDFQPT